MRRKRLGKFDNVPGHNGQGHHQVPAAETEYGDTAGEGIVLDDNPLITFVLMSVPESARIARWHVRAAFQYHGLSDYADDAALIVSELATNAIVHVGGGLEGKFFVVLMRARNPEAVVLVAKDASPYPPVRRKVTGRSERGRGLQIIEALSAYWGWSPEDGGKAVWAVLKTPDAAGKTLGKGNQTGDAA